LNFQGISGNFKGTATLVIWAHRNRSGNAFHLLE
jgi:hypothetical protein